MKHTLLDTFYTEISSTFSSADQGEFKSQIRLNPEHPVYKGHFAQVPVAPGVCLIQMIREILEQKFQKALVLRSGDNIKFLAMINPKETPQLEITFAVKTNSDLLEVSATFISGGTTYLKFKGKFVTAFV